MKRIPFRTARRRMPHRVRRLVAGVVVLGLALSASAKDASISGTAPVSNTKAEAETKTAVKAGVRKRLRIQIGVASWYGSQFQGRRTAAGELFDMNTMTCAHPTLPMGTWLRVTNLKNRRTAFVRVNDRGPVIDGRIVDLSYAAARMLGMSGLAKVKLETVLDGDTELAQALLAQAPVLSPGSPGSTLGIPLSAAAILPASLAAGL
jgi:rare lipoprotein A